MYYPKFPEKGVACTSTPIEQYDLLAKAGLYVLPKQADKKLPVFKYWRKDSTEEFSRELALSGDYSSGWCVITGEKSGRVIVIDLDTAEISRNGESAEAAYTKIQTLSASRFVLATPANGAHIYYRVPEHLDMIGNIQPPIKGVDLRGEGGQVVSLGGKNLYKGDYAAKKGVPDGHEGEYALVDYGVYTEIPFMSDELYAWLTVKPEIPKTFHSEKDRAHFKQHFAQPTDRRNAQVLEYLTYVLSDWDGGTYEEWIALWMSAHQGSAGSNEVRDYILTHPNIYWSDGEDGRTHFRHAWDKHEHREGGYTISTLKWLATQAGWGQSTGYEIPSELFKTINVRYVKEWVDTLEEIPTRMLLMAQTGSGKTYNVANLYHRLAQPKTLILVPSIKLATELAATLRNEHGLPADLYRDEVTGVTKDRETLEQAKVLVTTLQTFSRKVHAAGTPMSDYGLVYVEESDQLLAQFARGGGGVYGSHVSHKEAMRGYAVIRDAMRESGVVWMVDATMSRISLDVAEATKGPHILHIVNNQWVTKKASVSLLSSANHAYQVVLKSLSEGKRVVVVADTARDATELHDTMVSVGALTGKKSIVITRATERYPATRRFIADVNTEAGKYDLVCYNSVMASGVSITKVVPDVIVQIAHYLTPRVNLQMINRYRNQAEVYCYYTHNERLYSRTQQEVLADAKFRADAESLVVSIPIAARHDNAVLRDAIAAMSVSDSELQMRSPRLFYKRLLQGDGRQVAELPEVKTAEEIDASLKLVRKRRAAEKDELADTWVDTPPITNSNPATADMSDLEVAQGEAHALVDLAYRGNISSGVVEVSNPRRIFSLAIEFARFGALLGKFATKQETLKKAEEFLMDIDRSLMTLSNDITLMTVLSKVIIIYRKIDAVVTQAELEERADTFMRVLSTDKELYDACITRPRDKFEQVINRNPIPSEQAKAFCKILLARVGLKQRRAESLPRGDNGFHIANLQDALEYLKLRYADAPEFVAQLDFDLAPIAEEIAARKTASELFRGLSEEHQGRVMCLVAEGVEFDTAVYAQAGEVW